MEFNGGQKIRILDDKLFNELKEMIKVKTPETLHDELEKVQAAKQKQKDSVKRPEHEQKKIPIKAYYYALPPKSKRYFNYHFYASGGINILKVPQSMLGPNVLGTANLKTNVIHILESLDGCAFEEVKKHELNHIKYPYLSEWEIRQKTRAELTFYPIFH